MGEPRMIAPHPLPLPPPSRGRVGVGVESPSLHPAMNQASAAPEPPLYVRAKAPEWLPRLLAPVIGFALFVALWEILARTGGRLPDPVSTWHSAVEVFGDPFYRKGPNDQGIGWNVLASLGRDGGARRHPARLHARAFSLPLRHGGADHQHPQAGVAARLAADRPRGVQGRQPRGDLRHL